jgi:hypothetical protein
MWKSSLIYMCAASLAVADGGRSAREVALSVPNEMSPAGGVVQMKFMVTEPTPISSGGPRFSFDSMFDAVWGVELFSPRGDVNGAAILNGSHVNVFYTNSGGASGNDYPIMTVALHVRPDAAAGTQTQFSLDPASTWILGLLGVASLKPEPPATVSVAGTISITNVVPGGGLLPAGTVVSIQGIGFDQKTRVQLSGVKATAITVVSKNEIQFTLAEAANMTGVKIEAVNPDGSQDTYFSYMRGVPLTKSSHPLLQNAIPIFSSVTHSEGLFAPMGVPGNAQISGLALQNPGLTPATATVSLYSLQNVLLGRSSVKIPSGYRLMAATSELTNGATPPAGSFAIVSSTQPLQMFGFIADEAHSTLLPFAALLSQP